MLKVQEEKDAGPPITKRIVEKPDGMSWQDSKPHHGTKFYLGVFVNKLECRGRFYMWKITRMQ
jgi:hypothetical protein